MENLKFKLVATVLAFLTGVFGVWMSGFFSSSIFSSTPQSISTQIDLPRANKLLVEQTFDKVEMNFDQLLDDKKDLGAFNPSGNYHPLNLLPGDSEKFIQFDLQVRRKKGKLVAWGEIRGVQPWYKFTSVSVTENHLKFSTAKVGGVSYNFDGKFLGKGDFASQALGNGTVMLEGALRKFVNGKKVMDATTSFVYYPGC